MNRPGGLDNPAASRRKYVRGLPGQRTRCRVRPCLGSSFLISARLSAADVPGDIAEPHVSSVFPSVARPGTIMQAEVRGNLIKGAYAVWFDGEGLRGRVLRMKGGWRTTQPGSPHKDHLASPTK